MYTIFIVNYTSVSWEKIVGTEVKLLQLFKVEFVAVNDNSSKLYQSS